MFGEKNKNYFFSYILWGTLLLISDRILKYLALNKFPQEGIYFFSEKIPIYFKYFENYNIAFSIPLSRSITIILTVLILLFLFFFCWFKYKKGDSFFFFAIFLILGGALSNFYDRIFYGYVVDYVHFFFLPIFNAADIMIVVGAVIIIAMELRQTDKLKI